jgi:predicted transcriptional regulator
MRRLKLTNTELRILFALFKAGGSASFNEMLTQCGMCYAMFRNYAEELVKKSLVRKETFKDYKLTEHGRHVIMELMGIELKEKEYETSKGPSDIKQSIVIQEG